MSRIGRQPIPLPGGVAVTIAENNLVTVQGPRGTLVQQLHPRMNLIRDDGVVRVERPSDARDDRALHGLTRTLLANMVRGVTEGFQRRLEINGTGYRAVAATNGITLQVGYSHPVDFPAPAGITLTVEAPGRVTVAGSDKQLVGETAARIRRVRPPEPYKGKGIKYAEEVIRRKAGKAGGKK
jgi:large subunit ribosomal protein L6